MTKEKVDLLMMPRIRVDHLYPGMQDAKVGDIFDLREFGINKFWYCEMNNTGACGVLRADIADACIANGSNIFRKLEWWEYREESEMPEYVKLQEKVFKVLDKKFDNRTFGHCDTELENRIFLHHISYWKKPYVPATLEEYQSFTNKTTTK